MKRKMLGSYIVSPKLGFFGTQSSLNSITIKSCHELLKKKKKNP
jgi:hypothetical protein